MVKLIENDIVRSVQQNIKIILTTPKGSDIHRPEFGTDIFQFIDKPISQLTIGKIKAEIVDAIETWEPRVKVKEVKLEKDYSGKIKISLLLDIQDEIVEYNLWM
ncbi:GPW/gp25 family protein [Sulfurihydrogenibium sp.]|uniref:GPW/gp25 family protein n=1 Tax=Sulfurihydrogenibium sp. TaxID=2053621 RepID=UPI00262FDC15|nr:GPW/gp25 family protein [Sulfurihydrogenibium sp.]